ncbi:MAG: amidohydrolase [Verrucomicrobia bacterium]|nr:amidohydrolase [Verrucomicrobiota bacterium]
MNFAIINSVIFTVDPKDRIIFNGAVAVENGRISYVGPTSDFKPNGHKTINGQGKLAVIPGLIDVHSHSSLLRGFSENKQLMDWLPEYQLEHQVLIEEDAYAAALLCYAEAVKGGTTCVMDMYRYMHRCAEAAERIGIRANLVPYVATAPGKHFFESIASNEKLFHTHHGSAGGKIRVWLGMEHLFYCTPETYRWAADFSKANGIGIHTHSSEQKEEVAAVVQHFGKRPIRLFYERGILGPNTVIAHCVWLDDDEIDCLASTGTAVAHCPVSNAKLACGVAPIRELQAKKIRVGLGTDGPISNNSLDLFEEMKFASLIQKNRLLDASALPAATVLRMATIDGARTLNLSHEIGSLEVGKKADLATINLWKPHMMPICDEEPILWNLIYSASGSDIDRVFVDGKCLVDQGRLASVSEEEVLQLATQQTHSLLKRRNAVKGKSVPMQG